MVGFGWTNGVLLHFMEKYGDVLKYDGISSAATVNGNVIFVGIVVAITKLLLAE